MRKADVLLFFNGSQAEVARAIGITRASVNGWPDSGPIPEASAYRVERALKGKLKVDPALYAALRAKRRAARNMRRAMKKPSPQSASV